MESNELHELHEQHEHAHEGGLQAVSFTMALLAVLVAIVTVLGHRTHTEAVLSQARASDQWNMYQARKIRQYNTTLMTDLLSVMDTRNAAATGRLVESYKDHLGKWNEEMNESEKTAREFEEQVERAEHRAGRYDLGEALLEIGLVITSITLLTRRKTYWYLGGVFGVAGLIVAITGFLAH